MRKPDAAPVAAARALLAVSPAANGRDAPLQLVCLALVLAVVALGLRIVTVW
jgi:hypothetical protein